MIDRVLRVHRAAPGDVDREVVRVIAWATLERPVVLEHRFDAHRLQALVGAHVKASLQVRMGRTGCGSHRA
ncbi:MAG TPA: hypothetical protein VK864_00890, partial [Longimicrobiales bacterium]|nr:hypothetical protein [Longimicrobiales bacterium]